MAFNRKARRIEELEAQVAELEEVVATRDRTINSYVLEVNKQAAIVSEGHVKLAEALSGIDKLATAVVVAGDKQSAATGKVAHALGSIAVQLSKES